MPKDIENSSLLSKSDDSVENNVNVNNNAKNRRRLSVNIVNWTLLIISTCIVTFVITNKYYGINNVNNNDHNTLESKNGDQQLVYHRRILKESTEMRKPTTAPSEPTLAPTEEPSIQLTHSPDFLSGAPTPTFSHAPNFLSAAPSPSYTHAPDYPKTMPPSQEGRKLLDHPQSKEPTEEPTEFAPAVYRTRNPTRTNHPTNAARKLESVTTTNEPTIEPTEMVRKTRSPNHYRTRAPSEQPSPSPPTDWPLLFQDTAVSEDTTQTFKNRALKQVPPDHTTSEPTASPSEETPTYPTQFAPAVAKTGQPTLTEAPNVYRTEAPNLYKTEAPNLYKTEAPTEEYHKVRELKKNTVPERETSEPTASPSEETPTYPILSVPTIWSPTLVPTNVPTQFAPAVAKTGQPTLTESPNVYRTETPNLYRTDSPNLYKTYEPTNHPTEEHHKVRKMKKSSKLQDSITETGSS